VWKPTPEELEKYQLDFTHTESPVSLQLSPTSLKKSLASLQLSPISSPKSPLSLCKRALHFRKRALYSLNRALEDPESGGHTGSAIPLTPQEGKKERK